MPSTVLGSCGFRGVSPVSRTTEVVLVRCQPSAAYRKSGATKAKKPPIR
jgi:hypothetical protein